MKNFTSIAALSAISIAFGALPSVAAVSTSNDAVIVDGNAFLRSSWVQSGLKPDGSFGSQVAAPAGYSSLLRSFDWYINNEGFLGMIADPNEDGFGGTDDGGDFILPGAQFEAWGIKVDDNVALINSIADNDDGIYGSWISSETEDDASVTWESEGSYNGIEIIQTVSVPIAGDHVFHVTVSLRNIDSAAHTVYYSRQVDPNNGVDAMLRDGFVQLDVEDFATFNSVLANSDASQIVTATSYYNFTTIGYRASDADASVRISDWSSPLRGGRGNELTKVEMDAQLLSFRSEYKAGAQDLVDSTIDITFRKEIAAGATAVVEFDYILDPREVDVPEQALDLALDLAVGGTYSGNSTILSGGGLAPNSNYSLTEFSVPNVIFSGTTLPNGNFYGVATLPDDCRPGSHTLVLSGTSPTGDQVNDWVTYTLDEACEVTAFDPYAAANGAPLPQAALANTGFETSPWLLGSALVFAAGASSFVVVRRRTAMARLTQNHARAHEPETTRDGNETRAGST